MNETEIHDRDSADEICRLEWIALAIDAARRYKESEHAHRDAARATRSIDEEGTQYFPQT